MRFEKDDTGKYKVIEIEEDFSGYVAIVETYDTSAKATKTEITVSRPSIGVAVLYAALSLIFLAVAIYVGHWVFTNQLGPHFEFAYYGAIVVLAISVAIVLFGCLRSYAHLSGRQPLIQFEVGGAAAIFALVVLGAFFLARPPDTFNLIIRFTGEEPDPAALQGLQIQIDLGERRDQRLFLPTGEAVIPNVPTSLVGQDVHVALSAGRVHLKTPTLHIPADHVAYLNVTVTAPP